MMSKQNATQDAVTSWIADLAMKDDGKVFLKSTTGLERAPVTYGDIRELMRVVDGAGAGD